jgi:hypothetical protein
MANLCKCGGKIHGSKTRTRCKACDAEYQWYWKAKNKWNLSREDVDKMWIEQDGCCQICTQPFVGQRPAIDHCHTTNKVRGLLCMQCNTAIGLLKDNTKYLSNAISYLEKQ